MSTQNQQATRATAALDIRNFIGTLLGLYGLILTATGLFGDAELQKTGGVNANLWAGIFLLIVSAIFLGWARLRPVTVVHHTDHDEAPRPGH
ncbi:MAG: hypothetical protein ACKOQ4_15600 [Mycobacterium sp.]